MTQVEQTPIATEAPTSEVTETPEVQAPEAPQVQEAASPVPDAPVSESVNETQTAEAQAEEVAPPLKAPEVAVTETQAPEVVTLAPEVVEEADPKKPVVMTEEEAYLAKIEEEGTTEQKRILAALQTFAQRMNPRCPALEGVINDAQVELLGHLQWALNKDYDVFRQLWNVVLVYFAVHHGKPTRSDYSAISEYSTNRFLHSWSKGEEKCEAYKNLLTLIRMTRHSSTRKHDVKAIKLDKVGPNVITQKQLENLQKFYQV